MASNMGDCNELVFNFQNLKNQILTTNVWMEHVSDHNHLIITMKDKNDLMFVFTFMRLGRC